MIFISISSFYDKVGGMPKGKLLARKAEKESLLQQIEARYAT
jgi:hypothetical protein